MGVPWSSDEKAAFDTALEKVGIDARLFMRRVRELGLTRPPNAIYARISDKKTRPANVEPLLITNLYRITRKLTEKRVDASMVVRKDKGKKHKDAPVAGDKLVEHVRYIVDGWERQIFAADEAVKKIAALVKP